MAKYAVAPVSEIPVGTQKLFYLGGRPVAVFNIDGSFFAVLNRCPHQGASLCDGEVTGFVSSTGPGDYRMERPGEFIRCPWHGWEFDIRNGQSWFDPVHTKVKTFRSGVARGAELVKGPYKAETFEVSLQDDYVVVEA